MINLQVRPGILMRRKLVNIRFICRNTQESLVVQLLMLAVFVVIRKSNNRITLPHIRFLHLLRRQIPVGDHRMAVQICFIKSSFFR